MTSQLRLVFFNTQKGVMKLARQIIGSPHDDSNLNNINHNFTELYSYLRFIEEAKEKIDEFLAFEGVITSDMIQNASITGNKIANGSIYGDKVADNSLTGSKLKEASIGTRELKDGSVNHSKLGIRAITWENLDTGAVTTDRIADNSVSTSKVKDSAIDTLKLANDAVWGTKLKDESVTNKKIGKGAVDSTKIADYGVKTINIATGAVDRAQIAENAVNSSRIADYSILGRHINGKAIAKSMIQDNAIDHTKTSLDALTINKGKEFPMIKIGTDDKQVILDAILDVKVHFADVNAVYSLNYIGKDTTSWETTPQTFIEMAMSYDGFNDSHLPLIGRLQTDEQALGSNNTGIKTHVINWDGIDEVISITIDWDALTLPNNNFRSDGKVNYIIDPSQYFFRRSSKGNPVDDLEDNMAFNINGRNIKVKEKLDDTNNIIYEFGTLSPNDFFEIKNIRTQSNSSNVEDYSGDELLRSSTDWVSPYGMLADTNPVTDSRFTVGGGHGTSGGAGFPTGSYIGISNLKVDGKNVTNGNHIGKELTFTIEHYISASNVINLETGEKRNTAKETRYYKINKSGIHVEVELEALEPITMTHYAGLQTIQRDSFNYFYYRGDKPEKLYTVTGLSNWELPTLEDAKLLDRVVMYNPNIVMIMKTDRDYGIGTGEYIPESTENIQQRPMHATPNVGKIYMHNLGRSSNSYKMATGDSIAYRGQWSFVENKSDDNSVVKYNFNGTEYTDDISVYEVI